jgi:hypothetical protein
MSIFTYLLLSSCFISCVWVSYITIKAPVIQPLVSVKSCIVINYKCATGVFNIRLRLFLILVNKGVFCYGY